MDRILACVLLHGQSFANVKSDMTVAADQLVFEGIQADTNVKKGIWAQLKQYKKDSEVTGGLVIREQATAMLGISKSRMYQFVKEGRFEVYKHFGKEMFGADEIVEYARIAKISGKGGVAQKRAWDATKTVLKSDAKKIKAAAKKLLRVTTSS